MYICVPIKSMFIEKDYDYGYLQIIQRLPIKRCCFPIFLQNLIFNLYILKVKILILVLFLI